MSYEYQSSAVINEDAEDRALFIRRVYMHLAGAVALFIGLEYMLITSEFGLSFAKFVLQGDRVTWLGVLGGFVLATWMARAMAGGASRGTQYFGLALYTFAEAVIFIPLIYIAVAFSDKTVLPNAAILTSILFLALTSVSLTTRRDFSFLGSFLTIGGFVALGLIICGAIFGFDLGLAFSGGMVLLAGASILFTTNKVMNQFSTDQYVGAALELFASLMLLFWYILRILIRLQRR